MAAVSNGFEEALLATGIDNSLPVLPKSSSAADCDEEDSHKLSLSKIALKESENTGLTEDLSQMDEYPLQRSQTTPTSSSSSAPAAPSTPVKKLVKSHTAAAVLLGTSERVSIGFAIQKRNDEFHELFPDIDNDEFLVEGELFTLLGKESLLMTSILPP